MRRLPACGVAVLAVLWAGLCLKSPGLVSRPCAVASSGAAYRPLAGAARVGSRGAVSNVARGVREPRRQASAPFKIMEQDAKRLTSRITKTASASELLELLSKTVEDKVFNEYHMSAALTRLAKCKKNRPFHKDEAGSPVWAKLASRLRDMLLQDMLSARGVANVFYAVGELFEEIMMGRHMSQVLPKLCKAVRAKSDGMVSQALLNCLYSAAKLQDAGPEALTVVPILVEHVLLPHTMSSMNAQDISNYLWAAATLQEAAPEVSKAVPAIAKLVPDKVDSMKAQEWSNSFWAAARLQEASPKVLAAVPALVNRILQNLGSMSAQQMSNCLWAAAKLQDASPTVLLAVPALSTRVRNKAQDMKAQELSACLWAAAKLQDSSPEVLAALPALAVCVPMKVENLTPQGLSNCLWAAAKLQDASPELLAMTGSLEACMTPQIGRLTTEGLRMSLWAARQLAQDDLVSMLQAELHRRKSRA